MINIHWTFQARRKLKVIAVCCTLEGKRRYNWEERNSLEEAVYSFFLILRFSPLFSPLFTKFQCRFLITSPIKVWRALQYCVRNIFFNVYRAIEIKRNHFLKIYIKISEWGQNCFTVFFLLRKTPEIATADFYHYNVYIDPSKNLGKLNIYDRSLCQLRLHSYSYIFSSRYWIIE